LIKARTPQSIGDAQWLYHREQRDHRKARQQQDAEVMMVSRGRRGEDGSQGRDAGGMVRQHAVVTEAEDIGRIGRRSAGIV